MTTFDWGAVPQDFDLDRACGARFGVQGFTPFHFRDLTNADRVDVYRNLNEQRRYGRVRWSIRDADTGLVLGHADTVAVSSAWTHVNPVAQAKVAAGGPRSVHAWVTGQLCWCPTDSSPWYQTARRVSYDPHLAPRFTFEDTGERVDWAGVVRFDARGMWAKATN